MLEIGSLIGISKTFLETFSLLKTLIGGTRDSSSAKVLTDLRDKVDRSCP
ncbi:hypothetical protein GGD63_006277 [Bradyrhizobium sp. cir1]|nr:hypothetical protein [Bradyrhizobium sp. cir1]MBB4373454.1 hypothetical protein [Bradyrhizobium sp. cir1]